MKIKIFFKEKTYLINKKSLIFVLSKLEHKEIKDDTQEKILLQLMKKYNLFDIYFLDTINKI